MYEKVGLDTVIYIKDREILSVSRKAFDDVVVWNPYVEGAASMGDFEPKDGWKNMVCRIPKNSLILDMRGSRKRREMDENSSRRLVERISTY